MAELFDHHDLNSACERRGLDQVVPDVDVPGRIVDWLEARAGAVRDVPAGRDPSRAVPSKTR